VDFTREPIIETVITPKEGCKLVVRSSKATGQEEYFVDAVEVVSFGNSFFFRSLERPKSFLVPVSDYEILEVREARMVLKNIGLERSIKIGGGRESGPKIAKETSAEKAEHVLVSPEEELAPSRETASTAEAKGEVRGDRKRERRSRYRRRRGRDESVSKEGEPTIEEPEEEGKIELAKPIREEELPLGTDEMAPSAPTILPSILPPPPTLISETIARYKDNAMFKGAFFMREESEEGPAQDSSETKLEEEAQEHGIPSFSLEDETFHTPPSEDPVGTEELPSNNGKSNA
jgi:hypothetical protein